MEVTLGWKKKIIIMPVAYSGNCASEEMITVCTIEGAALLSFPFMVDFAHKEVL